MHDVKVKGVMLLLTGDHVLRACYTFFLPLSRYVCHMYLGPHYIPALTHWPIITPWFPPHSGFSFGNSLGSSTYRIYFFVWLHFEYLLLCHMYFCPILSQHLTYCPLCSLLPLRCSCPWVIAFCWTFHQYISGFHYFTGYFMVIIYFKISDEDYHNIIENSKINCIHLSSTIYELIHTSVHASIPLYIYIYIYSCSPSDNHLQ